MRNNKERVRFSNVEDQIEALIEARIEEHPGFEKYLRASSGVTRQLATDIAVAVLRSESRFFTAISVSAWCGGNPLGRKLACEFLWEVGAADRANVVTWMRAGAPLGYTPIIYYMTLSASKRHLLAGN